MFPSGAFGVGELTWDFDFYYYEEITLTAAALRQAAGTDAEALAVLCAGRDLDVYAAIKGRH